MIITETQDFTMKILFYGDSNTWGYDAKDASRQPNRFTQLSQRIV